MKNKVATAAVLALLISTAAMAVHFTGYDSVDGTEIRFDDHTSYDVARSWAATQWNALGAINIAPDTIYTISDLDWQDVNRSDVAWNGAYSPSGVIYLNSHFLAAYTEFQRSAIATHELGHALGLGDHSLSDYASQKIIMYYCSLCSGVNTPQSHDKSDYNSLW